MPHRLLTNAGVVAAFAVTLALATIPTSASAAAFLASPGGCTIVAEPTPQHHTVCPGAVFGPGQIPWGADLSYAQLQGARFEPGTGLVRVDLSGADLSDADLRGTRWMDVRAPGVEALRANFAGVSFSGSLDLSWANLTSTVWTGATGLDEVAGPWGSTADQIMAGSSLAHADLSGVTLVLSPAVWFTDANLRATTFLVPEPVTWPVLFHDADLREARFEGWGGVGPAQFHRADLRGAVIDTSLNSASFIDADLRGAAIQPSGPSGLAGVTIVDSDLRGATLPPPGTGASDVDPWLYQWHLVDSDVSGTPIAPVDVTVTTTGRAPVPVEFQAGAAWDNPDGQDPFHADRDYWSGASLICDHDSGALFPVGRTTVACTVGFDHYIRNDPPVLNRAPGAASTASRDTAAPWRTMFDRTWTGTGAHTYELAGTGARDRATNPPADADLAWFAEQAGEVFEGWLADSVWSYANQPASYTFDTEYVTTTSAPMTFAVDVHTTPELTATASDGVVGRAFDAAAAATGWPAPSIAVTGLPEGVTWTTDTGADPLLTTATFVGEPAPGQGGWHDLEFTATNTIGSDTTTVRVWIVDPGAELTHGSKPLYIGAELTVTGTGFTPAGQVRIFDHHDTLLDIVDADDHGRVPPTTYPALEEGQVHFRLVDQTTQATARTPQVNILAPPAEQPAPQPEPDEEPGEVDEEQPVDEEPIEDDPVTDDDTPTDEPDELGVTGLAGTVWTAIIAVLLTAAGTAALLWARTRRRSTATAHERA